MECVSMAWSKAYLCKPINHLVSHQYINAKPFRVSYANDRCPAPINLLMANEYLRIWQREHNRFDEGRKKKETKVFIKPDRKKKPKKKQPRNNEPFKMKRFETMEARVDHKGKNVKKSTKNRDKKSTELPITSDAPFLHTDTFEHPYIPNNIPNCCC